MRIFFVLALLFSPLMVSAQSVLINEVAWMGTPVENVEEKNWWRYEWLELFNNTDTVIALDGWALELYRDKLDFTLSLQGTIVPNGYYVAGASEKILNLDLNYKNLGGKLNNSRQRIVLKNTVGEIVDEVDARTGWPAGDNKTKQTMERVGQDWQTSQEPGGTPKAPNSEGIAEGFAGTQTKLSVTKEEVKLSETKDGTEKDLSRSSSFQSRVPIVNPITLLAGVLALGFSGVLLLVRRSLVLRQRSGQESRQERQQS